MSILAVIELEFDPLIRLGELTIRWETVGVTIALLVALTVAGLIVATLGWRLAELVLIVLGIVPGAVIGGRLVHGLVFWEFYSAYPYALLDPDLGTLSLLGAVLGGLVSAAYVARQMGVLIRPWLDAAAVPMLLAMGLGKLALVLGGSGQGTPFDGAWALAFAGSGPWVSAYPELPSHPSQVYEGLWLLMGIPVISALSGWRRGPERTRPLDWEGWTAEGWLFVGALVWFLFGRLLVGFTWRDDAVVGPLNAEQVLALAVLLATLLVRAVRTRLRLAVPPT